MSWYVASGDQVHSALESLVEVRGCVGSSMEEAEARVMRRRLR